MTSPWFISMCVAAAAFAVACERKASELPVPEAQVASAAVTPDPSIGEVWMCPMDKDIRAHQAGKCPRCGMQLVTSIPEPAEYHMDLEVSPTPAPGRQVDLRFEIFDPWKGNPVSKFEIVHEKLFHAFIVSRDLTFFTHAHPEWKDGAFHQQIALPKPGMYRILGDFYPEAATPQLLAQTVLVPGVEAAPPTLGRDYSAKRTENMSVAFASSPEIPVAGSPTRVRFTLEPAEGLERYLGAWGHMLAASDDLIDMMHTHPFLADGSAEMQFNLIFPRPRVYRVWVQFQRNGVINTASFDVPVIAPPSAESPAQ